MFLFVSHFSSSKRILAVLGFQVFGFSSLGFKAEGLGVVASVWLCIEVDSDFFTGLFRAVYAVFCPVLSGWAFDRAMGTRNPKP